MKGGGGEGGEVLGNISTESTEPDFLPREFQPNMSCTILYSARVTFAETVEYIYPSCTDVNTTKKRKKKLSPLIFPGTITA